MEQLWKRVEDAREKWQSAHRRVVELAHVSDELSAADGSFACKQAINEQLRTVDKYLDALEMFKFTLQTHARPGFEIGKGKKRISPREREVLKLIASGKSSRQIAARLGIAFKTAVAHRYHLHQKLKVRKSVNLIRVAIKMGLIES